jgi:hypothetical protein
LRDLRPELPRPAQQTPLEGEVAGLHEMALGSAPGEPMSDYLDEAWFTNVSLVVVDAVVARDMRALDALEELIREVYRVVLTVQDRDGDLESADVVRSCVSRAELCADFIRSAQTRVAPTATAISLRGSRQERFLRIVADQPGVNSRHIGSMINADQAPATAAGRAPKAMDEGQLSKIGHGLRVQGYVFAERTARGLSWDLTPRGREVLDQLSRPAAPVDPSSELMVVVTSRVLPVNVSRQIVQDKPSALVFIRSDDTIKYQRVGSCDPTTAHAIHVDQAVKSLLDDDSPISDTHFTTGSDRVCYAQTAEVPARVLA